MNLETISENRSVAIAKWREYRQAVKKHSDPKYKDLAKLYNQLKNGKKLIDVFKVIQKGGIHANHHPKLAIARADAKKVTCKYFTSGKVTYQSDNERWNKSIELPDCLPKFTFESNTWNNSLLLEAPVPMIPPIAMPAKLTEDYFILWEVDEWKMIPPTDPWLLKRITKTLFVVLAGWDLTELEKAVMVGRMY